MTLAATKSRSATPSASARRAGTRDAAGGGAGGAHGALAVHFHDTYGQALANILACLEEGVRVVDSAVSGTGGCPYAKGATGNVASEDVVYMLHGMGMDTGIDLDLLVATGAWLAAQLHKDTASRVTRARTAAA